MVRFMDSWLPRMFKELKLRVPRYIDDYSSRSIFIHSIYIIYESLRNIKNNNG